MNDPEYDSDDLQVNIECIYTQVLKNVRPGYSQKNACLKQILYM